eukprot:CAMPEP_0116928528 /NCGR_PEP_ID=MMETSP0467-20121206/26027_1 /TAXON_ID=283647 /ORGANISM="Mesodinium pulex, Strain SPMC105" /LENGTH=64 /DNA_ID=CAMNT_0004608299 /DNA_START=76 /DNA_END=266 /DNA_ORIENTATION=+
MNRNMGAPPHVFGKVPSRQSAFEAEGHVFGEGYSWHSGDSASRCVNVLPRKEISAQGRLELASA